ncbi:uracil-DNA glycosylase family protein [Aliikangiella sp. G2MR2-5]|uniref:uracil-DNA glycosylase family protein n=1 Tax=Aliikangiella sp. G2MR2-5 TaxID=2788943 RepID=UPI0018A9C8C4|nr:uracil-DNA glycosylase family protein [Aliikangiella sp. G2MR2-5]
MSQPVDLLSELIKRIEGCRLCEASLPLGANPVVRAQQSARLIVAGQAPGIRVHKTSIPFNDPSGERLRQWMGVDSELFYNESKIAIIPMAFCYPGRGTRGDLPPRKECSTYWHPRLLPLIPKVELILAIGQYAHTYYLADRRKKTLTETVKAWESYLPEILPLPHPSPRNNIWLKKNPWFEREVIPYLKNRIRRLFESKE